MCCKSFWKKIVPFTLTFIFGLLTVNILQKENSTDRNQGSEKPLNKIIYLKEEIGSGQSGEAKLSERNCFACIDGKFETFINNKSLTVSHSQTKPLQFISKPRPKYTNAARQNNIQGTVTLRVTFLANGEIGGISTVNGLTYGLTEEAIAAARRIKFEPSKIKGVPQTLTKQVQYNFTIY